jgi:hypothetical protein
MFTPLAFKQPQLVTDGLVLYLDAGDRTSYVSGSTVWRDLSTSSNNGTLTNGPTFNSSNGGSIVCDGVDDGSAVPNSSTLGKSLNYTTSAWIKYNNTGYTAWMMLIDSVNYGTGGGYMMWLNDNSPSLGKLLSSYDSNWQYGTIRIPPNVWTNVTIAKSGNAVSFYVNGVFDVTRNYAFSSDLSITEVNIGYSSRNSGYRLNGNVAIAQIYNRTLSASEVLQNFNAQRQRFNI